MKNPVQISPEIYEQVKAMVLAEINDKNKKREREEQIQLGTKAAFEPTRRKYYPLLMRAYKYAVSPPGQHLDLADLVTVRFNEIMRLALAVVGEQTERDAYLHGKAGEVNVVIDELLIVLLEKPTYDEIRSSRSVVSTWKQ